MPRQVQIPAVARRFLHGPLDKGLSALYICLVFTVCVSSSARFFLRDDGGSARQRIPVGAIFSESTSIRFWQFRYFSSGRAFHFPTFSPLSGCVRYTVRRHPTAGLLRLGRQPRNNTGLPVRFACRGTSCVRTPASKKENPERFSFFVGCCCCRLLHCGAFVDEFLGDAGERFVGLLFAGQDGFEHLLDFLVGQIGRQGAQCAVGCDLVVLDFLRR